MTRETRREKIVSLLKNQEKAISGREFAQQLEVSRQVIVQDIAILRAKNVPILSSPEGYLLEKTEKKLQFSFFSRHQSLQEMKEELEIIVDYGGKLLNIQVEHEIYGLITSNLCLQNRLDIELFLEKLQETNSKPLSFLTNGLHSHTVEVDDLNQKKFILKKLQEKGFLQ